MYLPFIIYANTGSVSFVINLIYKYQTEYKELNYGRRTQNRWGRAGKRYLFR